MTCGKRYEDVAGNERTCGDEGLVCEECFQATAAEFAWMRAAVRAHKAEGHTCNPYSAEPCRCQESW